MRHLTMIGVFKRDRESHLSCRPGAKWLTKKAIVVREAGRAAEPKSLGVILIPLPVCAAEILPGEFQ